MLFLHHRSVYIVNFLPLCELYRYFLVFMQKLSSLRKSKRRDIQLSKEDLLKKWLDVERDGVNIISNKQFLEGLVISNARQAVQNGKLPETFGESIIVLTEQAAREYDRESVFIDMSNTVRKLLSIAVRDLERLHYTRLSVIKSDFEWSVNELENLDVSEDLKQNMHNIIKFQPNVKCTDSDINELRKKMQVFCDQKKEIDKQISENRAKMIQLVDQKNDRRHEIYNLMCNLGAFSARLVEIEESIYGCQKQINCMILNQEKDKKNQAKVISIAPQDTASVGRQAKRYDNKQSRKGVVNSIKLNTIYVIKKIVSLFSLVYVTQVFDKIKAKIWGQQQQRRNDNALDGGGTTLHRT